MVEGARLESVFRGNSNVGSNPTLSASLESITYRKLMKLAYTCVQWALGKPASTGRHAQTQPRELAAKLPIW